MVIEIKADKSIAINNQPVAEADLTKRLTDIFAARAQKVLFVKGDKDLEYRYVVQAIAAAKGADPDMKVGIMTPKIEAGQYATARSFDWVGLLANRRGKCQPCFARQVVHE